MVLQENKNLLVSTTQLFRVKAISMRSSLDNSCKRVSMYSSFILQTTAEWGGELLIVLGQNGEVQYKSLKVLGQSMCDNDD